MIPILSIYTVSAFRKREVFLLSNYEASERLRKKKAARRQTDYFNGLRLKELWLAEDPSRVARLDLPDSENDVNLHLKFGRKDKLDSILLFLEEHVPDFDLEGLNLFTWLRVKPQLCLFFHPETSEHCKQVPKYKQIVRTSHEYICI